MDFSHSEHIKRKQEIDAKAANPNFKPGTMHGGRFVDPLDYDRREQQRLARKRKNYTLDPHR